MIFKIKFLKDALILASLLLFFMPINIQADEKIDQISIVSESWDKYSNLDGSGLFLDISRAIFEPQGISLEIEYIPYKRALHRLKVQTADAMYGTYSAEKEGKDYLITPRSPIDIEQTVAIYKATDSLNWHGVATMENLRLAWVRGYDYHENLPIEIKNFTEVTNSEQGLDMLKVGRFDFFLDHAGELYDTIKRIGFKTSDYQSNIVLEENVYMAFANNHKGKKLSEIYDKEFERLKKSGELKAIFDQYDINYPFSGDSGT